MKSYHLFLSKQVQHNLITPEVQSIEVNLLYFRTIILSDSTTFLLLFVASIAIDTFTSYFTMTILFMIMMMTILVLVK